MTTTRHLPGHTYGYARVSTADQEVTLQMDALAAVGCDRVFVDRASGARSDRPELARLLELLLPGDTVVVWRLDRLGRSLRDLLDLIDGLEKAGVGFRDLSQSGLDTTTPNGRLVFTVFAALAEFERALVRERTLAGLAAAAARGRKGGRPSAVTGDQAAAARAIVADGGSIRSAAGVLGVSRSALHRALRELDGGMPTA